jgi:septal ring factor EnvC (AmiA/AmiB activator)
MVRAGEVIGVMGATGNTQGAHLHLNVRKTDDNKNPIETNNGYKGFVNPLPILQIINNPPMANTIQVDTKLYEKLVGNSTAKKEVAEYLKIVNPDDASAEDMKRVIGGIQSLVTTAQNESSQSRVELSNAKEEIIRIREALLKSDTSKDGLLREAKTLRDLTESQGRDIGGLKKEKVELENQIRELKKGTITSLDSATLLRLAILKFLHLG